MSDNNCTALANPITQVRIDALISDFEARGIQLRALSVIAALTDIEGLHSDDVALVAEAVLAWAEEGRTPVDKYRVEVDRPNSAVPVGLN